MQMQIKNKYILFAGLILMLIMLFALNIFIGVAKISFSDAISALFGSSGNEITDEIVFNYRLPKAITALLTGAALSVSGLLMQTLFRNALAGPDVLGVSSGAGLGVALLTLLSGTTLYPFIETLGSMAQVLMAVFGALLVLLLILSVSARISDSVTILVLGMIFGYVTGAAITVLQSFADPDSLKLFITWTFGSLSNVTWDKMPLLALFVISGVMVVFFLQKPLNTLLLGERYAASTGMNVQKIRLIIIITTAIITGVVTAFSGPIAFVGVVIPHFARSLFGTVNHKTIIPATLLLGAILLIGCDIISQIPLSNRSLPINAVTALFGAPMIVWIVLKRKKL